MSEVRVEAIHNDGNAAKKEQEGESLDVVGEHIQVNTSATDEDSSEFGVENLDNVFMFQGECGTKCN